MKVRSILVPLLMACLLFSGCGHNRPAQTADGSGSDIHTGFVQSESVDADVYLDGTMSMAGYVNYANGTVYGEAVKGIERSIQETWKDEKVNFVKFGDAFTPLSRDGLLQANQAAFYNEKDTSLQKVVEQSDDKKLNVVITDLFQTNQDIDSLMNALKAKCFAQNHALAVIGMKSQFNGKIYDVGKSQASFEYATNDDPASYRPFYLMVYGNENDVRAFTEAFTKNLPKNVPHKEVLLSANFAADTALENDSASKGEKREKNVAQMAEISNLTTDDAVVQYRLKLDEKASKANIALKGDHVIGDMPQAFELKADKVEKSVSENGEQKTSSGIRGWINKLFHRNKNNGSSTFQEMKANDFLTGAGDEVQVKDQDVTMSLNAKVDPSAIKKDAGVYLVQFSLIPEKSTYLDVNSKTFDEWNFEDNQAAADANAVGSKTLNINTFIRQLSSLNYELNKPGFHNLYIYFDAQ